MLEGEPAPESAHLGLILRWHRHYKAGHLAVAGGVWDQPAFLQECIDEVESAVNEYEAEQREEREQERAAKAGGREGQRAQVLGKLRPDDVGPDWKRKLRKVKPDGT